MLLEGWILFMDCLLSEDRSRLSLNHFAMNYFFFLVGFFLAGFFEGLFLVFFLIGFFCFVAFLVGFFFDFFLFVGFFFAGFFFFNFPSFFNNFSLALFVSSLFNFLFSCFSFSALLIFLCFSFPIFSSCLIRSSETKMISLFNLSMFFPMCSITSESSDSS